MKEITAEGRVPKKRLTTAETAADSRAALEEKIASYEGTDKVLAEALPRIITTTAPELEPKTWGMPAYALDGNILCVIQDAAKFGAAI